ncbi:DUF1858 domain-containing protein [archaeon]|nr:DUF1858 domain-containing protein [archaeon]
MNLAEVIKKNPKVTEVFLNHGLHCIGCIASAFETIEEGAKVHGMNDKQISKLIQDLNK